MGARWPVLDQCAGPEPADREPEWTGRAGHRRREPASLRLQFEHRCPQRAGAQADSDTLQTLATNSAATSPAAKNTPHAIAYAASPATIVRGARDSPTPIQTSAA
jgi:hypothetical protein